MATGSVAYSPFIRHGACAVIGALPTACRSYKRRLRQFPTFASSPFGFRTERARLVALYVGAGCLKSCFVTFV